MDPDTRLAASFKDPSGFLFEIDGALLRQINQTYRPHYDRLMSSGLYKDLLSAGLLLPHEVSSRAPLVPESAYLVIEPTRLRFVSYPYEWCFSQLRDAALVMLEIQERSLKHGMSLKDASAYNIQFHAGRPLLIDSLSFERLTVERPWIAYRQFCQHFLAPLALMAWRDPSLGGLARIHIDGIPLGIASRLLPWRTKLSFALLTHIHLHAAAERRYAGAQTTASGRRMTMSSHLGLVDSLWRAVNKLRLKSFEGRWERYDEFHGYSDASRAVKREVVGDYLKRTDPRVVWDMGANIGDFSRIASDLGAFTVAFDLDHGAVERNYQAVVTSNETHVLPLVLDLTNPSPALGWAHRERESLVERGPASTVLALALLHHLAIGNNIPLPDVARFLAEITDWLIIEFVPKSDPQVKQLLANREDIFPHYTAEGFEAAFANYFRIQDSTQLSDSNRSIYLMKRRPNV
jgi:hypothetical protein